MVHHMVDYVNGSRPQNVHPTCFPAKPRCERCTLGDVSWNKNDINIFIEGYYLNADFLGYIQKTRMVIESFLYFCFIIILQISIMVGTVKLILL
jgi:hypothetical protein